MRSLARPGPLLLALVALAGCGPAASDNPVVVIEVKSRDPLTEQSWKGTIKAELYRDKAPRTVKNFLRYVDEGHYDGTVFHRVVNGYLIQGGNHTPGFSKPTHDPIPTESDNGLSNRRGTLALARTRVPDSARDQFFINLADNDGLDRARAPDGVGYCVFGKVIDGMHVVDRIKKVETSEGDVPVEDVIIESIRRKESE